jgi:hypothetical protein
VRVQIIVHDETHVAPLLAIGERLAERKHKVLFLVRRGLGRRIAARNFTTWSPAASWWAHGLRSSWVAARLPGSRHSLASTSPELIVTAQLGREVETLAAATGSPIVYVDLDPVVSIAAFPEALDVTALNAVSAHVLGEQLEADTIGFCVPPISKHEVAEPQLLSFLKANPAVCGVFLPVGCRPDIEDAIDNALARHEKAAIIVGSRRRWSRAPEARYFAEATWLPTEIWPRLEASIHLGQSDIVVQTLHAGIPSVGVRLNGSGEWIGHLEANGVAASVTYGSPGFESRLRHCLMEVLGNASIHARASLIGLHLRAQDGAAEVALRSEEIVLAAAGAAVDRAPASASRQGLSIDEGSRRKAQR